MKLLVIGASGRTGKLVLAEALRRGHAVTALTRRPTELAGVSGLSSVIAGEAIEPEMMRKAVAGQDAVIMAVGHSGIAQTAIAAMQAAGTPRLVMTSSLSVVTTQPWLAVTLAWLFFRPAYTDLARAEGMLAVSGLDWRIVRATMLTDKPGTGQVHITTAVNATGGDWSLTRADYAMVLVGVAEQAPGRERAIGVTGVKASRRIASPAAT